MLVPKLAARLAVLTVFACAEDPTFDARLDAVVDAQVDRVDQAVDAAVCTEDRYGFGTPELPAARFGFGEEADLVLCAEPDWFALDVPPGLAVAVAVQADRPVVLTLRSGAEEVAGEGRAPRVQGVVAGAGAVVGVRAVVPGPSLRYALRVGLPPSDCEQGTAWVGRRAEGVVCGDEVEVVALPQAAPGAEREVVVEVLGGEGLEVGLVWPGVPGVVSEAQVIRDRGLLGFAQPAGEVAVQVRAVGFGGGFRLSVSEAGAGVVGSVAGRLVGSQQVVSAAGRGVAPLELGGAVVEVRSPTGRLAGLAVAEDAGFSVPVAGPVGSYTLAVRAEVAEGFGVQVGPPGGAVWSEALVAFALPGAAEVGEVPVEGATVGALHVAQTAASALRRLPWAAGVRVRYDWRPGGRPGCGSCFRPELGHIELTGAEGDEDEWDDAVILHELGHALVSRDDSPGGRHTGARTWPVLAWSEGFAHFFAGWALGGPVLGDLRSTGYQMFDLETADEPEARGTSDGTLAGDVSEYLVAALLWDAWDAGALDTDGDGVAVDGDALLRLLARELEAVPGAEGVAGLDLADVLDVLQARFPEARLADLAAALAYPWP